LGHGCQAIGYSATLNHGRGLHGDQCKNQKKRLSGFVVGFAFIAIPKDQCFGA
jgi:hypothetical protein